jgi:hypothetical protein
MGECNTLLRKENAYRMLYENLKEKDQCEDLSIDSKMLLKQGLKKEDMIELDP